MWFLFGFITMISFIVFSAWARVKAPWRGTTAIVDGQSYTRYLVKNKGKVTTYYVAIDAPSHLNFMFKRESWLDRFFKGIGISSEHQVGRSRFDDAIYIVSDDEQLCRKLSFDQDIQSHILAIFNAGSEACEVKSIQCSGGRVWVKFKTDCKEEDMDLGGTEKIVVPLLHRISSTLSSIPQQEGNRWNDPFVPKAIVILSVSTGLAINGGLQIFRMMVGSELPFTVDSTGLWKMAAIAGLAGAIVFFIVVMFFLGRSARAHLVLIEVMLVGSFGVAGSAFFELRDLNMEWDTGAKVRHDVQVIDKLTRKSRKSSRRYYVVVQDWHNRNEQYEIKVSSKAYGLVEKSENVIIYEKPGYLAFPWVAEIVKADGTKLE
jgi:hypothetical protein